MTGPEHYHAAEKCMELVDDDSSQSLALLAEAQVHATLALAAATALNSPHPEGGFTIPDHDAWMAAASAYKRPA